MAEYVRMPKAHYEAACNSIRAKTGKTDLIKSGAMSAEIDSITTGGGSSDDVRYVTFMNHDGTVEYGKLPVAVGYDCPNPKFDDPTRESTAQYNYTFYGWATTPNGGADANWYKSITEDKTVYANFSSTVRTYTITFCDEDGSVFKSEPWAYGSVPSYTPTKEDYLFNGWTPEPTEVTGDATYTAKWVAKPLFSTASWEEIDAICQSGLAASTFNIGDTKTIHIPYFKSDGKTIYARYNIEFQIIGFDIETKEDGTKAAITIASTYALADGFFGKEDTTLFVIRQKGWGNCLARTLVNSTAFTSWPSDLKTVIKSVKKVSNAIGSNSSDSNVTTIDKLWVPSVTEYSMDSSYTSLGQGTPYARLYSIRQTPYIQYNGNATSGNQIHATRSDSTKATSQMIITANGYASSSGVPTAGRICFCI